MKNYIVFIGFYLLLGTNLFGQSEKSVNPRSLIAYKANESLNIDGESKEQVWNQVDWSEAFIDIEGHKKPKYNTQIKMLWDMEYIYILAKMEEPHVWATLKQRDTIIFYNNDFEVFIDPDGDTHNYYEIELNAYNTIWDLFITKPYREGNVVLNDWTATGLKSAIKVNGTINNPRDTDIGWVVELAIPWATFKKSYFEKNVPADKFWRINFSRVNWDFELIEGKYSRKKNANGKFLHEYNWVWSPTGVVNMHEPEKWGYVYFSSKEPGETEVFEIPNDEKIKWHLYGVHRALKTYFKKHQKYPTSIKEIVDPTIRVNELDIKIEFERHYFGYNLYVKSPFSKKTLLVKKDGEFIAK